MIIAIKKIQNKNPKQTNQQQLTKDNKTSRQKHDFPKSIPFQKASLTLNGVPCIGGDPGGEGGGEDVSPLEFFWGDRRPPPPLEFWKLEKYIFIYYLHFKHNESNTKRLIQHKNTNKHTKSLNLPRASRADSRPNHISASLALPVISVAGEGGTAGGQPPPPPNNAFSEFCRYMSKFVATCKRQACHFVRQRYLKYQQNIERK